MDTTVSEPCLFPLLTEAAVARLLNIGPSTLRKWRQRGHGPKHLRLGGVVRYRPSAVEAFLNASAKEAAANA